MMPYNRAESDAKYDAEKRRTHPDYPFWRSRQWRDHIRPAQLRRAPLCEVCAERGVTTLATQVDHRIRPMGDYHLQRDPSNLRSCCASCHSRKTMADQRGFAKDVTVDGYPTDPNHLANKPRRQTHNTGGGREKHKHQCLWEPVGQSSCASIPENPCSSKENADCASMLGRAVKWRVSATN